MRSRTTPGGAPPRGPAISPAAVRFTSFPPGKWSPPWPRTKGAHESRGEATQRTLRAAVAERGKVLISVGGGGAADSEQESSRSRSTSREGRAPTGRKQSPQAVRLDSPGWRQRRASAADPIRTGSPQGSGHHGANSPGASGHGLRLVSGLGTNPSSV